MAFSTGKSERAKRLPPDWQARRLRVLRRDRYACQARLSTGYKCLERANQVDHIEPGDDHDLDNLQALCRWHHARKTSAEGAAARTYVEPRRRKPEGHPGLR